MLTDVQYLLILNLFKASKILFLMPDVFTHTLVGIIVSSLLGKVEPTYILLAVFLSTIPDVDAFLSSHRALFHSLVALTPPSLALIILFQYMGYGDYGIVAPLLPLIHVFLDALTGGIPVKLFYPISRRGYQFSSKIDYFIVKLLEISPYGYYIEVIRVNMILTLLAVILLTYRYLTAT